MFDRLPRPTIFAHRGASAFAPENTIAAFDLAVSQNADGIELDTKLSSDGRVIVIHDQTLERTTDGKGRVSDFSLSTLKELDAGKNFSESFRGETIPTLDEVFEAVGSKIFINVEIANYASPMDSSPEKIASIIKHHELEKHIMISSFNPVALRRFGRNLPEVPIGLLALPGLSGAWARIFGRWLPFQALHPELKDTNRKLIRKCHLGGLRVYSYTVNEWEQMKTLFEWGIDGIFTDDPVLAKRALDTYNDEIPKEK